LDKVTSEGAGPATLLEIGAGAGNTAFPILTNNRNPLLKIHACDFSKKAVEVMRSHESYNPELIQADVWDVAGDSLPPGLGEGSVDVALMVFIFSALSPSQWKKAVENVYKVLKPGGEVCFRDYGRGDLAQVRFKKGRYLEENFYIRGDGTRVYFFEPDELAAIWSGKGEDGEKDGAADTPRFEIEALDADRRLLVNRARKLKMYRCWLQGRFRKK
jgi:tRNAThr (cytosine32-N3)-methyltransferase